MAVPGVIPAPEDAELQGWQRRLAEKRAELQRLQDHLTRVTAEKEAAQRACGAGIAAARAQMNRLRGELQAVKRVNDAAAMLEKATPEEEVQVSEKEDVETADDGLQVPGEEVQGRADQDDDEGLGPEVVGGGSHEGGLDQIDPDAVEDRPHENRDNLDTRVAPGRSHEGGPPDDFGSEISEDDGSQITEKCSEKLAPQGEEEVEEHDDENQELRAESTGEDLSQRREQLQMQLRALRHEVSRWRHQAETVERERPQQEEEIVRLKAELTHTMDVLESTRQAAQHYEVDKNLRARASSVPALHSPVAGAGGDGASAGVLVPLFGGGHGGIEAHAERGIRERVEHSNQHLASKAKQLMSIASSQQLLIQRLEKALLTEEGGLEKQEARITYEKQRHQQMKRILRRRSDDAVAAALGVPGARRRMAAVAATATVPQAPLEPDAVDDGVVSHQALGDSGPLHAE